MFRFNDEYNETVTKRILHIVKKETGEEVTDRNIRCN